jgi:prepilin-type N-terminal cleavage/methylation domain-containing protein/prepilin-type processing-associated H-X9-DG protein
MQVTRRVSRKPHRRGFTLIELLVVISIIAVLAALILPGINAARETARRTQCMSQMRNVSLALQTYATNNSGALPYLISDPTKLGVWTGESSGSPVLAPAPWSVALLPYLEFQTLYDRITTGSGTGTMPTGETELDLKTRGIQVYTCPDDPNSDTGGTLSFSANAGYTTEGNWTLATDATTAAPSWTFGMHEVSDYLFSFNDYNNAGTPPNSPTLDSREVQAGTGVFIEETGTGGYKAQIDRMSDGSTHTIVLTENLQAETWYSPNPGQVGIVVPFPEAAAGQYEDAAGGGIGPDPAALPANAKALAMAYGTVNLGTYNAKINAVLPAEGRAPRPSSQHPNVVNVFFADGHGGPMSQNIADSVWVRLVSSAGERFGQPVLGDNDF